MTRSDEVFKALAKDILSGVLEPGRHLDEPSVCRQFGVSRTPVREALRRLSGTGLVEVLPRRGVTVAQIDVDQLNDMFEALAEFEGLCAKLSAERMTSLEKKRLEMLNKLRDAKISDGDHGLALLNNDFHEAIYQGSHSPSIASVTRNFRQRLAPFSALQFVRGRAEYGFHQHDQIVNAILNSDGDNAQKIMRDHISSSAIQVIEHFSQRSAVPSRGRAAR